MECTKCGLPLLGTEHFCPQCGARLGGAPQEGSQRRAESAAKPPPHADPTTIEPEVAGPDEAELGTPLPVEPIDVPLVPIAEEPDTIDVPLAAALEEPIAQVDGPAAPPVPEAIDQEDQDELDLPLIEATDVPAEPIAPSWQRPRRAGAEPRSNQPSSYSPQPDPDAHRAEARRWATLASPLGLGIVAGCLFLFILSLGLAGIYQGQQIRAERQKQEATGHYEQGKAYLQAGEYDLAIAEFEYAIRLRPNYLEAQQKLAEARAAGAQLTPSAATSQEQLSTLLAHGRAAYDRGAWDEAIQQLETLEALDPNYEQTAVRRLLAGAYANSGLELVNADRLEEAIRRFNQALSVEPGNPDIQLQSQLATLYQGGLTAWDVDWPKAIQSLADVYNLQPDYKDTTVRLHQAYVHAGDAAGEESAWCAAEGYYKSALDLTSTPEIAAKRDDAAHRCASSPDPNAPVPSGTLVGIYRGQKDNQQRASDWAQISGQTLDEQGEPIPNVQVQISAFDWTSSIVTTDHNGYYEFLSLNHEITFTVTLVGVPVQPVDVPTKFGYATVADFVRKQ